MLLQWCARVYLRRHTPYVIGITGSVGKTSCRMILTQTLTELLPEIKVSTSPKNFNSEIGLPLAVLEITDFSPTKQSALRTAWKALVRACGTKRYDVVVLEYGIDAPGDMEILTKIIPPQVAIFTGLDKVHAHQLGGPDEILQEKSHLLLSATEIVFYPIDGEYLGPYLAMIDVDKLSYSLHEDLAHDADIGYTHYDLWLHNNKVYSLITLQQWVEQLWTIRSNMIGRNEVGYLSLGVSIAMILERRLQTSIAQISDGSKFSLELDFALQPGRCSIFQGIHASQIIDSSYNAAPTSMLHMIKTTIQLRQELFPEYQLRYCLGDMRELGEFTEREHRNLAAIVAQSADKVYLVGEHMRSFLYDELLKLGFSQQKIQGFPSSKELGRQLALDLEQASTPALCLFKWSQNTIFLEDAIPYVLADASEVQHLCRQSDWWKLQKQQMSMQ